MGEPKELEEKQAERDRHVTLVERLVFVLAACLGTTFAMAMEWRDDLISQQRMLEGVAERSSLNIQRYEEMNKKQDIAIDKLERQLQLIREIQDYQIDHVMKDVK